jgi:hypothetical protein
VLKSIEKMTQPADSQQSNSMFTLDPSLWFEMQVQVTMPGEVIQTNGSVSEGSAQRGGLAAARQAGCNA